MEGVEILNSYRAKNYYVPIVAFPQRGQSCKED